jgi:isoamylase
VHAPSLLGPTVANGGVSFGVYSENATRLELLLFDGPDSGEPRRVPMQRAGDVWSAFVPGATHGQLYGFAAWGPNWGYDAEWTPGSLAGFVTDVDAAGNRFNPNKLLYDPYARGLTRDHDWSRASAASGPMRAECTWAAGTKSIVVASRYAWSEAEASWRQRRPRDVVIYEVHPKGFTASPSSGVQHPGTFRGFGEKADYLAELGITAVELMPVHAKARDGGYWGYQSLSWFAPEPSYAADPGHALDEMKWMIDQLHQRGIEVLLDVVYNHTGEGGLWRERALHDDVPIDPRTDSAARDAAPESVAAICSYRGLDNAAYYALTADRKSYVDNSGCGQQTRPNHVPMRRLILDSLHFWVEEMHVDGFRFDLAPVLAERDLDYSRAAEFRDTVIQAIADDPVLRRHGTRLIAEPWSMAHFRLGSFPDGWSEWNGRFRDVWRGFLNGDDRGLDVSDGPLDVGGALTGSRALFGDRPGSVNFITAHDGFTLYDLFAYDRKRNGCGLLNPRCCDERRSRGWCERDSGENHNHSRAWPTEGERRQMARNAVLAVLLSRGTPMLLGGDEWLRTQHGHNNPYSSGADNPWAWFDWEHWRASPWRRRMHAFVRAALCFRRERLDVLAGELAWKRADNRDMEPADWRGRFVMQHYWRGPRQLLVVVNMESAWTEVTLPSGVAWERVVDTQEALGEFEREALTGATYAAAPRSVVIFEES